MENLIIINNKYKFIIVLNPKSACSTIRNLYLNLHFTECTNTDQRLIRERKENAFHYNNYSYFAKDTNVLNNYKDYYIFSFVRNTYNKICSAFYNRYLNIQYELMYRGIGKENTFLDYLKDIPHLKSNDHHYSEQIIHNKINEYIDIEKNNIYDEFIKIYQKLGVDNIIIEKIKIFKEKNKKLESAKKYTLNKDLTNYNFRKNKDNIKIDNHHIPSYNCLLNNNTIKIIKNLYKEEISFFKFDVPI
jgi:hypothetical protein